VSVGSAVVTLT